MEKLIVINDDGSAELLTNLKRFDGKWMTKNNKDTWEYIEGIYFEVSHLDINQIQKILNRFDIYEEDQSEDKCWAVDIDWSDAQISTIALDLIEVKPITGMPLIHIDYIYDSIENSDDNANPINYDKKNTSWTRSVIDEDTKTVEQFTYNGLNLKPYQKEILNNCKTSDLVNSIIETIVCDIYSPSIICDNLKDEENITNYLESFNGFNTKHIATKLLYNGYLEFEVLKGKNNRYLNCYDKDSTKNKVEGFFSADVDLKSYYSSMIENYDTLNLENSNLKCSHYNSNEYFDNSVTYKEYKFIKDSFLLSDYFNVSQTSKYNLLNINDYKNFTNLLEKSIVDFYYSLIKADDRFKNVNFKLEI